jgi:hypothetical protein
MRVFAHHDLQPSGNFSRELQGKDAGDPGVSLIIVADAYATQWL